MALKVGHKTTAPTDNGLTIAERDKIDEVIKAMPREWQKRALHNIDPDLIVEAANEQLKKYSEFVNGIRKVTIEYQNKSWDLLTLWEESKAYEKAIKEAHRMYR